MGRGKTAANGASPVGGAIAADDNLKRHWQCGQIGRQAADIIRQDIFFIVDRNKKAQPLWPRGIGSHSVSIVYMGKDGNGLYRRWRVQGRHGAKVEILAGSYFKKAFNSLNCAHHDCMFPRKIRDITYPGRK